MRKVNMSSIDKSGTFALGTRTVKRLGYGAMQLAGPGAFGPPKDDMIHARRHGFPEHLQRGIFVLRWPKNARPGQLHCAVTQPFNRACAQHARLNGWVTAQCSWPGRAFLGHRRTKMPRWKCSGKPWRRA